MRRRDALKLGLGAGAIAAAATLGARAWAVHEGSAMAHLSIAPIDRDLCACDQLHLLTIHRRQPRTVLRASPFHDSVLAYDHVTFNDKLLSASERIQVRQGERVRFHFYNTSTTQGVTLGLAQHRFRVVALDGHPVPKPGWVERLYIGPTESIDAVVKMDRPGRWVLGATHRDDRRAGLGRLIEYAGSAGAPTHSEFGFADWDVGQFGAAPAPTESPTTLSTAPLCFRQDRLIDSSDPTPRIAELPINVSVGQRIRLAAVNGTRDVLWLRVLGHDVELLSIAGRRTAGVRKDVVVMPSFTRVEFEFVVRAGPVLLAHQPDVSLSHPWA